MKKFFVVAGLLIATGAIGQTKKPATPVKKPAAAPVKPLKTLNDSASYALGLSMASFYKQQGITKINTEAVSRAINDVTGNKKILLNEEEANSVMMRYISQAQEAKAKPNVAAGEKFLAANKVKPEIKTTASGLQYEVLTEGTGPKPAATDTVLAHYAGTLLDGTEFDNSYKRGQPIRITVDGVIKGWTEALQLMPVGSKYKLYIPHHLGYGMSEAGPIPAGSVLIFEVELVSIVGK